MDTFYNSMPLLVFNKYATFEPLAKLSRSLYKWKDEFVL